MRRNFSHRAGGGGRYGASDALTGVVLVVAMQLMLAASGVSAASFYGTSHVYLPLSQASTETSIHLILKTSRSKGLLLLASGDTDYCIIQIRSGVIEVRVNMGGGELTVRSLPKEKLNDLRWHSVRLDLAEGWLELYIDGVLHREERTLGQADTLNVQDGIYVGGTGSRKASYLKSADRFFRGCIENVTYNDILVFNATAADKRSTVNDITWDCSEEFEAAPDAPISFVKETAFVLYPKWQLTSRGSFACWLKTSSALGLLMFSSGSKDSFIAAEVVDGRVRVLMKRGSGVVDFTSQVVINDGYWHWLKIDVAPANLRISLDYEPETITLADTSEDLELTGMLHVGGVIHKARAQAFRSDLKSVTHASSGGSYQGCLRDIEVNNELFTLGDSRVTHGIEIGCVYVFPCLKAPCPWTETCSDIGPESFVCQCITAECLAAEAELLTTGRPFIETSMPLPETAVPGSSRTDEAFSLVPLTLEEGGRSVITTSNIHLNLNLHTYGLRESQLLLFISKRPEHGQIKNSVLRRDADSNVFTFLDLSGSKIFYIHDGSENFYDEVSIRVQIPGRNVEIPKVLQGGVNITLGIDITPVNDAPGIALADDATLRMIHGSVQPIHSSFLEAIDPDNDPDDLLFTIVNQQGNVGYFQNTEDPGRSIVSFTQDDVNEERVSYVHTGPNTKSRIVIRITDGLEKSPLYSFRIEVVPLELSVLNATELRLNPGSTVEITPSDLQVKTNDPEDQFIVNYRVTNSLRFGKLQRLGLQSWWLDVTEFTQADVDEGSIRYTATVSDKHRSVWNDRISLSAWSEDVTVDVTLQVKIVVTSVEVANNTGLILNVIRQGAITSGNLSAEVHQPITSSSLLTFKLIRPPSRGQLIKQSTGPIPEEGTFTQDDIVEGLVGYVLNPSEEDALNDTFLFQVSVVNAESSVMSFSITYIPDVRSLVVVNTGLTVLEGGTIVITTDQFFVSADNVTNFAYTITEPPSYGQLQLTDPSTHEVISREVTSFLNFDLMNGLLQYQHDDSETESDIVEFLTSASYTDLSGTRRTLHHEGVIDIHVLPKNDHEPEVIVNRLFKVVKNGKTPLTDQNLLSADGDDNFNDDNLEYRRQNSAVGDLIYAKNESVVYQFTQRELKDGLIAFRQRGVATTGRMLFFVFDDDRSRYTSAFLDIEASEPFLDILNNSGLMISRGSVVTLTSFNLSAETNLGIKDKRIEFLITSQPSHGMLLHRGNPVVLFTQESLEAGRVAYQHDNSTAMLDSFNFTIRAKDMAKQGVFNIRIYLTSHQQPPEVEHLKPLVVEQGQAVIIDRSHLKVTHPNHLPVEIVFTVTLQPSLGILQLSDESPSARRGRRQTKEVKTFTQLDVNRNRLRYVQTESEIGVDRFSFEVDNGFVKVSDLTFVVEIAPTIVPLRVSDFFLPEGGSKAITDDIIQISHPYYQEQEFDFTIKQQPIHGFLETTRNAGQRLTSFSTRDISNEFIYFVHDDSDTVSDSFTIMANSSATGKTSLPYTINVTITPVNDQQPEVIVNEGLTLFLGTKSLVTTESLSAVDLDTDDQSLIFILSTPTNGYLVKLPDAATPVLRFTQADLASGDIVFVHSGSNTGGFRFSVSDGVHSTIQQIFSITAEQLLLTMEVNAKLLLEPNSIEPITADHLKAVTNEEPKTNLSRPITFLVTEPPLHGIIVEILDRDEIDDEILSFAQISKFTQAQINRNVVAYKQILDSPVTEDQFSFNVQLPLSQNLTDQVLEISIGKKEELLPTTLVVTTAPPTTAAQTTEKPPILNLGIEVLEGGTVSITGEQLNIASLPEDLGATNSVFEYNILSLPRHGVLKKAEQEITAFSTFMQDDLSGDGIQYIHDHSDERQDSFNFTITATAPGSTEQAVVYAGQFVITIDPINDQPFRVVTRALRMTITQGARKTLTMADLNTIDADNPPDEIWYELLSSPSNGKFFLLDNPNVEIQEFTQEQINRDEIVFLHDGGDVSGGFLFRVSDGAHMRLKQFSIIVNPIEFSVAVTGNLTLNQGDPLSVIPSALFNVTTNGDVDKIRYNVSTPPEFGEILVGGIAHSSFSQKELNDGSVQYSQTDFSSDMDFITFIVSNEYSSQPSLNLTVTVKPAVSLKLMNITTGDSLALTTEFLNATNLFRKVGEDLVIEIIEPPQRGLILNSTSNLAISKFSYLDIVNSRVTFVADNLHLGVNDTLNDTFTFVLSSESVQPAYLTFQVRIQPRMLVSTTTAASPTLAVQPATRRINTISFGINRGRFTPPQEVTTSVAPSDNTPNAKSFDSKGFNPVFVIIPIIVIIIIIICVLFVLIWRSRKKEKKHVSGRESPYPEPDIGPYPGAQAGPGQIGLMPTIQVMGACPDHHSTGSLNGTPPVTVNRPLPIPGSYVPQVTVTPLGRPPSPNYTSFVSVNSNGTVHSGGSGHSTCNRWDGYSPEIIDHGLTKKPTLKKSQYWV